MSAAVLGSHWLSGFCGNSDLVGLAAVIPGRIFCDHAFMFTLSFNPPSTFIGSDPSTVLNFVFWTVEDDALLKRFVGGLHLDPFGTIFHDQLPRRNIIHFALGPGQVLETSMPL